MFRKTMIGTMILIAIQVPGVAAEIEMQCDKTGLEGETRLDWTGGAPDYVIYRSGSPVDLMNPANEIGTTADLFWIDFPPVGALYHYRVGTLCTSTPEVCNDLDDDCDGIVDNGSFEDVYEPNEACAEFISLGFIGSDETRTFQPTLFGEGDTDLFRIDAQETDSTCACCDVFCTDEDYTMVVELTVPSGAGSYRLCATSQACSEVENICITVGPGLTDSISISLDGACPGVDEYPIFAQVDGVGGAFECSPYILEFYFDALVCH